jgi:hypothetical protein
VTTPATEGTKYRFGPLERRGLIAGWRAGQIVAVCVGLLVAVGALRERPTVASVALAVVALMTGLVVACWPIAGRTGEEWLPTVIRWSHDRAGGQRRRRSHRHLLGHRHGGGGVESPPASSVPAIFGGLEVLAVDLGRDNQVMGGATGSPASPGHRSRAIGVVHDAAERAYTSVVAVGGHTFALLGRDDQDRRVAGWSGLLASMAREGSALRRVGWLAATVPDDGSAVRSYVAERAKLTDDAAASRSYLTLLREAGASAARHRVHLLVQVHGARRGGVGRRVDEARSCAALVREVRSLCRRLGEIDIEVEGVLNPSELGGLFRSAIEDGRARSSRRRQPGSPSEDGIPYEDGIPSESGMDSARCPWPLAVDAHWGSLRTDGTHHVTYWIAEWPRTDVGPDFLGPLLLGTARRTVAIVMEPVAPGVAVRKAEQARTADLADAELRRRGGFLATARRQREREVVLRREAELADGHASFRFSGYVTITAATAEHLQQACEATEQAAAQSRLELRRLYGEQGPAFTFTLPLCRGLA